MIDALLALLRSPVDAAGFALFVLVFPVYHAVYPWYARRHPSRAAIEKVNQFRRSWIQRVLERREEINAIQATRTLTMVSSFLASSALLLMGFTANILLAIRNDQSVGDPATITTKLGLLIAILAASFAYFVAGLRHLGHFNLTIGADPRVIADDENDAVEYLATVLGRASGRYTLGVRTLYSAFAIVLWCFHAWLMIAMCVLWAVRFIGFQDFAQVIHKRPG